MTARQLHERLMEAGQHGAAVAVADHLAKLDAQHASHVAELEADLAGAQANHLGACKTIAEMHAAAVGEVTGAKRGLVEDVADVRAESAHLKARVALLEAQLAKASMPTIEEVVAP